MYHVRCQCLKRLGLCRATQNVDIAHFVMRSPTVTDCSAVECCDSRCTLFAAAPEGVYIEADLDRKERKRRVREINIQ